MSALDIGDVGSGAMQTVQNVAEVNCLQAFSCFDPEWPTNAKLPISMVAGWC